MSQAENNSTEVSVPKEPPAQAEMPFAVIQGEPLTLLPEDLYIPPDALEVFLEAFEGPLDLLLYLIKRQNLDVLDIPIAHITKQYMQYIDMMESMRFELAAEYLLMAAMLAEIKSRMLLPRPESTEDEDDPRAELVRRLQEYERFKQAAEDLDEIPRQERDIFTAKAEAPPVELTRPEAVVELHELLAAFKEILNRAEINSHHMIQRETLSIREKMSFVLSAVNADGFTDFSSLFNIEEGRRGVVVTFMAILELLKGAMIDLVQSAAFAPIYVKAASGSDDAPTLEIVVNNAEPENAQNESPYQNETERDQSESDKPEYDNQALDLEDMDGADSAHSDLDNPDLTKPELK